MREKRYLVIKIQNLFENKKRALKALFLFYIYIMKFLKSYEKYTDFAILKVGDYVYIDTTKIRFIGNVLINQLSHLGEIIKIPTKEEQFKYYGDSKGYIIELFYLLNNNNIFCYIEDSGILRKLTIKEIEEFEAKKNSLKYNL